MPNQQTTESDKDADGRRSSTPGSPSYRPFSSGSEFMDWNERNCCQCQKCPRPDHEGPNEACEIENAFALASICGGTINEPVIGDEAKARELADRLGWDGESTLPARCPEIEENAEVRRAPKTPPNPTTPNPTKND